MLSPTHWFKKIVATILIAFIVVNLLMLGLEILPRQLLQSIDNQVLEIVLLGLLLIGIIIAITFSIKWHKKEQQSQTDFTRRFSIILGLIRYWLAFEIATYGFAKVFKTQFRHSIIRDYTLLKDASGFDLTWFYFGYSQPLTLLVAALQIGGSFLLLFRRTTLLGSLILLPIMTNILLINLFYDIAYGAFLNSVLFTLALLLLVSFYWSTLQSLINTSLSTSAKTIHFWFRNCLRVLVMAGSAGFIFYFSTTMSKDSLLSGVWNTTNFIRNNDTLNTSNWQSDSLLWNKIYFDYNDRIAFSGNPNYFEKTKALTGNYQLDDKKQTITATVWKNNVQDTITLQLQRLNDTTFSVVGQYKTNNFKFNMHKQTNH